MNILNKNNNIVVCIPPSISLGILRSQILWKFGYSANQNIHLLFVAAPNLASLLKDQGLEVLLWSELSFNRKQLENSSIIYSRAYADFIRIWLIKKIYNFKYKILFDVRGLDGEESFLRNGSFFRREILSYIQKWCLKRADIVHAVSTSLAKHIFDKYKTEHIKVVPCGIPSEYIRHKTLRILDKNKSYNFVYVGSMAAWQSFDRVCSIFSLIKGSHNLTVVTRDLDNAQKILDDYNIKATLVTGEWKEVCSYLDNADFGFILRENNIVNLTASPVKLIEYAARGVIPIITPWVGDYSMDFADCSLLMSDNNDVISVDDLDALYIQTILDELYKRATKYTWENLSFLN